MPYVYSTLSSSQEYVIYEDAIAPAAPAVPKASVFIAGGANVADKHFMTPRGVVTTITEEQEKLLMSCDAFKQHMANGFVTIEKKKHESVDAVAKNLQARDESSPLTPQDVELAKKKSKKDE